MMGRTAFQDFVGYPAYDGYRANYGPLQCVEFHVGSEQTIIAVGQAIGYVAGNGIALVPSRKDRMTLHEFDWKDREKALEEITTWILENSSPEIVNTILPPAERKAAPPPAPPAALVPDVTAGRPVPTAPDAPSTPGPA